MRISDSSSDVCSSDLGIDHHVAQPPARLAPAPYLFDRIEHRSRIGRPIAYVGVAHAVQHRDGNPQIGERMRLEDRQSVGEGKMVSVRVDLGGRRNITKKYA